MSLLFSPQHKYCTYESRQNSIQNLRILWCMQYDCECNVLVKGKIMGLGDCDFFRRWAIITRHNFQSFQLVVMFVFLQSLARLAWLKDKAVNTPHQFQTLRHIFVFLQNKYQVKSSKTDACKHLDGRPYCRMNAVLWFYFIW